MATQTPRAAANGRKPVAPPPVVNRDATPEPADAPPPAEAAAPVDSERDTTLEGAFDAWSNSVGKEYLAWQIGACTAMLRGAQALRTTQLEAAQRAEAAHQRAGQALLSVTSLGDLASIQLELARADADGATQYWAEVNSLVTRNLLEAMSELANGLTRMSSAAWISAAEWMKVQSALPQSADVLEAEVEHVTSPLAASPLIWPAQEATRQAMTLASSAWNDWISWSGHLADAGRSLVDRAPTVRH